MVEVSAGLHTGQVASLSHGEKIERQTTICTPTASCEFPIHPAMEFDLKAIVLHLRGAQSDCAVQGRTFLSFFFLTTDIGDTPTSNIW